MDESRRKLGQVSVTLEYARHMGPRFVHGAVTLRFDSSLPYSFRSDASWPTAESYEIAVKAAVEEVLTERLGSLERTAVLLVAINWDAVASCQAGFGRAARAATQAAFQV